MTMTDEILVLTAKLGLGAFAVITVAIFVLVDRHRGHIARRVLACWARKYGYQFVSLERRWLRLGPFGWRDGYKAIFRGVVMSSDGKLRTGHFRVGTSEGEIGDFQRPIWDRNPDDLSDDAMGKQIDIIWER